MNVSSIKKVVQLHLFTSIKTMCMFIGGGFLAGLITVLVVMLTLKPDTYIVLGTILSGMGSMVGIVIVGLTCFSVQFCHQVKMNISRTSALVGNAIISITAALFAAFALLVFSFFENIVLNSLFGGFSQSVDFIGSSVIFFAGIMLVLQLAFVLLVFIVSAVLARFGRMGVAVAYFGFLAVMLSFPRIIHLKGNVSSFGFLANLPPYVVPLGCVLIALGFTLWSLHTLLTIDIT